MTKQIKVGERHPQNGTITVYAVGEDHSHEIVDGVFECDECGDFIATDQEHLSLGFRVDDEGAMDLRPDSLSASKKRTKKTK